MIPVFTKDHCHYCNGQMTYVFDYADNRDRFLECLSCSIRIRICQSGGLLWIRFYLKDSFVLQLDYTSKTTLLYGFGEVVAGKVMRGWETIVRIDYVVDDIIPSNVAEKVERWMLLI